MLNPQAEKLNSALRKDNPSIFALLSDKGQAVYFPKEGVPAQSAEAKGTKYNATVGQALEDGGLPVRLSTIEKKVKLPPQDVFLYSSSFGEKSLRELWLKEIKSKNPHLKSKTSLPIVTHAITHGLSMIGYLFIDKGDKIIIPDKFWGNYRLIFENAYGGNLETFNTFTGEGFDISSFSKKLNSLKEKKIIILLNFPNNPTGYTPTIAESKKLVKIIKDLAIKGKKVLVILDDAYFGFVYKPGILKESLFSFLAGLDKNILAVKVDGATKEEYAWGLRVGFLTYASPKLESAAYEALEAKTAGAIRGNISNASHLSQTLILEALKSSTHAKERNKGFDLLKTRFLAVNQVLQDKKYAPYFTPLPFNSGYFMCIKLKDNLDAEKIRQILIKKYSTGVIALKNLIRIAFSSVPSENIPILFDNILKACRI